MLLPQPPPSRAYVVDRGGKRVLGREPVVQGEDLDAARAGDAGDELTVACGRAQAVTAAVQEENCPGCVGPRAALASMRTPSMYTMGSVLSERLPTERTRICAPVPT